MLVAGSMTVGMAFTGPIAPLPGAKAEKPKHPATDLREAVRQALAKAAPDALVNAGTVEAASVPSTYRVQGGDTVSGIAGKFGLSTASVLALNGLGWKSLIFPGQVLKLSNGTTAAPAPAPAPANPAPSSGRYTIVKGDTISSIAARFGVSTQSVLSANGLGWSSIIYPGQTLAIPGAAPAAAPVTPAQTPAPAPSPEPAPAPAPAPEPAPITPAPAPVQTSYVIKSGDTVTSIASRFGVTIQAILNANGLNLSSIIYAGRTLIIPGVAPAGAGSSVTPLTAEMAQNARVILEVGRSLGVPEYGLVISLAAAMQESSLRNIRWGDLDSVGLFQQRPSAGWGTVDAIMDPAHSARLFFGGPSNPNKGKTRGLLDISGWESMTVTQAAQAVQRSAYPDAYAKWEASARAWLAQLS
ncbi:LysM peptidoglycan-binding domain-containing protein [Cryobacterium sp. BB307]|uniref:lytic transglycosylase n=1 Tax=Cryobacterium sp. BB307 TaxID=2716317 RepID=UPI001B2FF5E7|nr:LysM peptidoglycan-binding domain-containing protein [Cryobacterium sp. BB307]